MIEWRYLPGRRVRHALESYATWSGPAFCGRTPRLGLVWFGTGSQREYENCAAYPACRKCVAKGAKP